MEYDTDFHGNILAERCPGWFVANQAHIVVPVVPNDNEGVHMYPYDLSFMRRFLAQLAFQAHTDGHMMRLDDGRLDYQKMLDVVASMIPGAACTMGPINNLRSYTYKRSINLCIPYEYMLSENLTKQYTVEFD